VHQLAKWDIIANHSTDINEMFERVYQAHQELAFRHDAYGLPTLKKKAEHLRSEIQHITSEIAIIDERLAKVERNIIMNASILRGADYSEFHLAA